MMHYKRLREKKKKKGGEKKNLQNNINQQSVEGITFKYTWVVMHVRETSTILET